MARRKETPKWVSALAAGVATAAVVSGLHFAGWLLPIEYRLRDLRMRWTLPETAGHPDVVMVYYSEESLTAIRQKWNTDWRDRALIGNLFRGLSGKPSAKNPSAGPGAPPPTAVLYDFFTLCDPVELPDNIMEELSDQKQLYLAVQFSIHSRKYEYAPQEFLDRLALRVENDGSVSAPEYASAVLPVEEIASTVHGIGDVRSHTDEDGVDRRYHLLCRFRGRYYASFALAAMMEREKVREVRIQNRVVSVGSFSVRTDSEGAILLRYYRPETSFRVHGAFDVINGRLQYDKLGSAQNYDPQKFSGSVVIVGATAAGLMDLRVTPVSRVTPGPEIHAVAIANLLNGDLLRPVPRFWSFVTIALLGMLTALMTRYAPAVGGFVAMLFFFVAYGALSVWLFKYRWVVDAAPQLATVVLSYATTGMVNFLYEGRQKLRVKRVLQQHVSVQVAEKILKNFDDLRFKGERKTLSIFFMDFAGFTTLSEKLPPEELVPLINRYHETAAHEIFRTEGTLDKFIGDAIMAFWGDPIDQPDHAIRAVRAAIALQERLKSLAEELRGHGLPDIRARVGINTGLVMVANVGSKERHNYTAMGNDVNLASRLEGVNKEFGTDILISDSTYAGSHDVVEVREVSFIKVKGKTQAVRIFEVLGEKGRVDPTRLARARRFEEGLRFFRERRWPESRSIFEALAEDKASQLYLQLCDAYSASPPPADWDGSYVMDHK